METACDVNDAGQVVGLWTNPAYPGSRGYVWTQTDGMLPMPVHSEDADRFPLPGNNGHRGVSINASGTIAGTARGIDGSQFRAATLAPSGVLTQDSETFGDVSRASHAINAAGTVPEVAAAVRDCVGEFVSQVLDPSHIGLERR